MHNTMYFCHLSLGGDKTVRMIFKGEKLLLQEGTLITEGD